jgi:hypothetical protein
MNNADVVDWATCAAPGMEDLEKSLARVLRGLGAVAEP